MTTSKLILAAVLLAAVATAATAQHPSADWFAANPYESPPAMRGSLACPANPCSCCPKTGPRCPCLCGGGWCPRCCQAEDEPQAESKPEPDVTSCTRVASFVECQAGCSNKFNPTMQPASHNACVDGCNCRCGNSNDPTQCNTMSHCAAVCAADASPLTSKACMLGATLRCTE